MRRNNVEVRGCCCGIPFGCGSALAVLTVAYLWRPVTGFLVTGVQSFADWWR